MFKRFERELQKIADGIISIGSTVENQLASALRILNERDGGSIGAIFDTDNKVDSNEVELEEDCLKVLALYQPVANDLRFIVAALKINNDLERIGDLAVNIAKRGQKFATMDKVEIPDHINQSAKGAKMMLKKSLLALIEQDVKIARDVIAADDEVDERNRQMHRETIERIKREPLFTQQYMLLLSVSRHLEHIADLACNIAEDVIYMLEGIIVRHKRGEEA